MGDQKWIHFFSLFTFTFIHRHSLRSLFGSGGGGRRRGEMASSLTIKESFRGEYSTCKTSAGVNPASIFQRNPFQNFFHSIFFPREISCKKFKTHLQFYVKISNKKFSSFFTGKSLYNFSKKLLLRRFLKISLQEGDFENSPKFLQLVSNLTPIRNLF